MLYAHLNGCTKSLGFIGALLCSCIGVSSLLAYHASLGYLWVDSKPWSSDIGHYGTCRLLREMSWKLEVLVSRGICWNAIRNFSWSQNRFHCAWWLFLLWILRVLASDTGPWLKWRVGFDSLSAEVDLRCSKRKIPTVLMLGILVLDVFV